jgi:hypothetical protein
MEMINGQLFFSHTWNKDNLDRDNHARVYELAQKIRNCGWSIWIDEENMIGNIDAAMANGIDNAEAVIVCLTEKYCKKINDTARDPRKRDNCLKEWTYTNSRNKLIIPVVMEPCLLNMNDWPPGIVSLQLSSTLYIDGSKENLNNCVISINDLLLKHGLVPNNKSLTKIAPLLRKILPPINQSRNGSNLMNGNYIRDSRNSEYNSESNSNRNSKDSENNSNRNSRDSENNSNRNSRDSENNSNRNSRNSEYNFENNSNRNSRNSEYNFENNSNRNSRNSEYNFENNSNRNSGNNSNRNSGNNSNRNSNRNSGNNSSRSSERNFQYRYLLYLRRRFSFNIKILNYFITKKRVLPFKPDDTPYFTNYKSENSNTNLRSFMKLKSLRRCKSTGQIKQISV